MAFLYGKLDEEIYMEQPGPYSNPPLEIPVAPPPTTQTQTQTQTSSLVLGKRPRPSSPPPKSASASSSRTQEPPHKFQKVGLQTRAFPVAAAASSTDSGVPLLRVNPASSYVAIPVRQSMVKKLHEHFVTLYEPIHKANPTLAAEHALKQEEEVYKNLVKAVIQCIASIKRRDPPTFISHPSVGTEDEIKARAESKKSLESLQLSKSLLEPLIHSTECLSDWGYIVDVPAGVGGREPSLEGKVAKCNRCAQPFQVKRMEEADDCTYHWGRALMTRVNGKFYSSLCDSLLIPSLTGERTRVYTCCSQSAEANGCVHGPHVFYESAPEDLHARHGFSFLKPPDAGQKTLDVAALDCEMIYTTGGMRVARISIVDGAGEKVFDEFIRMDDGVHVIAKEKLDKVIQVGTADVSVGHSSLEDAIATLDLVRWHILNERKPPPPPGPSTS
ncbi:hypothetical protein H1R20_g6921, partial [Candolleomyces eurysporus]